MSLESVPAYRAEAVERVGECAVVVGASVSGLLTARILADAFDRVTVVERNELPDGPVVRDGAPQSQHPHLLQGSGRAILDDLFPEFGDEFVATGGLVIDAASDFNFYDEDGYVAHPPTRIPLYAGSRPLLEYVVRRRVSALDGVRILDGCHVTDYRVDDSGRTVTGVQIRGERETTLSADLTVDATGRASRTPRWLERQGYTPPEVAEVTVDLAYSTVTVDRDSDDRRAFWAPASPPYTRGGGTVPVEGGRRQMVLTGVHGDEPPRDADEFRAFASTLQITELVEILERHEILSDEIAYYPFPSNLRRYYERLDRFPDGLLVVGDAIASYNPVYGQGMSVAALHALVLHHTLADDGLGNLALRFFDDAEHVIDTAWLMAVGADFQFPQTTGPKPRGAGLMGWYLSRLTRKAHSDRVLAERLLRVILMERPPTSLLHPGVIGRVFKPSLPSPHHTNA
ncbi:NAD(P)/FAD-dependent oxidoreductase [Salinirubrum litoreum]|uniref:NAD(P)/FAD-dependent oxidoreductase n=1 Tax=Salinirubrum litoreum TaxID=1126234 RepID=A0ABD5R5S7_9EURY|nr:FAD-dependent monooxygenase [Salinirubrum litoreum]